MPLNKLILTQKTSVSDVVEFFKNNEPTKQVRARDLGDGRIELYVRKDSFKQFFTDKLRPGFLVERDYLKAQNHVLNIIKKSDPAGENSSAFAGVKRGLVAHQQNFYLGEFSNYLDDALYRHEEINLAKEILKLYGSRVNSLSDIGKTVNSQEAQQEISRILHAIKDPGDKAILKRNFDALNAVMQKPGPGNQTQLTLIDYNCAIDFFRVWLKEIKNIEGNKPNSAITQKLTAFAENVVRKGVPERIDLDGGSFGNSNADLIIFELSDFSFKSHGGENLDDYITEKDKVNKDNYAFTATTYSGKKVTDEEKLIAGFEINYSILNQGIDKSFMYSVYNKIGMAIEKKIPEKIASSSKSLLGDKSADEIYTIHLPVMNPIVERDLKPAERAMIQTSFTEATKKWVDQYPNLRIKVNLAGNMDVSSIQAGYRSTNKAKITN